jgi:Amt family ammonium transporter
MFDYIKSRKLSAFGFCSGAVSGLVAITPAAGFVAPWASIVIGLSTGIVCNIACKLKNVISFDDSLDAFGIHGVGGLWGSILTGFFAQQLIGDLDGVTISAGWIDGNFIQVPYQIAGALATALWSFVVTYIVLITINRIPGLQFRVSSDAELIGCDLAEMGETAYKIADMHLEKLIDKRNMNSSSGDIVTL